MTRASKLMVASLGVVAILSASWGCNGTDIDEPEFSDSLLVVDSVDPASIQADVSPTTDPNTMLSQPPKDDEVSVKVRNLNRTQSTSGFFGDVQISSFDFNCSNPVLGALVNSTGNPSSLTIPAESTADIKVTVFTGAFKQANSATLLSVAADRCEITFNGQDLSGEPILSQAAFFVVSFVDTP